MRDHLPAVPSGRSDSETPGVPLAGVHPSTAEDDMPLFRRPDYDRVRILDAADRARRKGRRRRAARLYRQVLAVEPLNAEIHARVAPLLAATGRGFDAWRSYRRAIEHLVQQKQLDAAAVIARDATRTLSGRIEPWEKLVQIESGRGRNASAFEALCDGRRAMRGRRRRPEAITLLKQARRIEPWNVRVVVDLARLLYRTDQADEAVRLLDELAERSEEAADLRRARWAQWRLEPSLLHTWRWIAAWLTRPDPGVSRIGGRGEARR